jgi:GNAT superfamily N-acetyltransferase
MNAPVRLTYSVTNTLCTEDFRKLCLANNRYVAVDDDCECVVIYDYGINADSRYRDAGQMVYYRDRRDDSVISHIFVRPQYRNQGVATKLVDMVKRRGKDISIFVNLENKDAVTFWLNRGFLPSEDMFPDMHKQFDRVRRRIKEMSKQEWLDWLEGHPTRMQMRTLYWRNNVH